MAMMGMSHFAGGASGVAGSDCSTTASTSETGGNSLAVTVNSECGGALCTTTAAGEVAAGSPAVVGNSADCGGGSSTAAGAVDQASVMCWHRLASAWTTLPTERYS
jgi:hypothetical protein